MSTISIFSCWKPWTNLLRYQLMLCSHCIFLLPLSIFPSCQTNVLKVLYVSPFSPPLSTSSPPQASTTLLFVSIGYAFMHTCSWLISWKYFLFAYIIQKHIPMKWEDLHIWGGSYSNLLIYFDGILSFTFHRNDWLFLKDHIFNKHIHINYKLFKMWINLMAFHIT